jgi:hypothetical protein
VQFEKNALLAAVLMGDVLGQILGPDTVADAANIGLRQNELVEVN